MVGQMAGRMILRRYRTLKHLLLPERTA